MSDIHFPLNPDGKLSALPGTTGWGGIPAVLVLHHTCQRRKTGEFGWLYQTDRAGMEAMIRAAEAASDAINEGLLTLAALMACCDGKGMAMDASERVQLNWFLHGVAELRQSLDHAAFEARFGLKEGLYLADAARSGE